MRENMRNIVTLGKLTLPRAPLASRRIRQAGATRVLVEALTVAAAQAGKMGVTMRTAELENRSNAAALTDGGSYPDSALATADGPGTQDTSYLENESAGQTVRMLASALEQRRHAPCIPAWKRALDLGCILLTMLFWLPVMALVSLWIKLVSPGPVLFRQTRVGLGGRRFTILKFRSMKVNAETGSHHRHLKRLMASDVPMAKLDTIGDPRLIVGGRWLRSLGLDELPQLFNVIAGDMSLVGPRPCTPAEFGQYSECQKGRVNVAPGLTGYWQVNGKNKTTFRQMIELDLRYAEHMNLALDVAILLATVPAMFLQCVESRSLRHDSAPQQAERVSA
jgi:lipopolysaccharide/colanic/teichoic acid biosynthesis glycosyltransferase